MFLDGLGEGPEDDPQVRELVLERRRDGDAVEDRVDRDAREALLLLERDPQLRVEGPDLRIDILEALDFLLRLRGRVVDDVLVVDRRVPDVRPSRRLHREPVLVSPKPLLAPPFLLLFLKATYPDAYLDHSFLILALTGG